HDGVVIKKLSHNASKRDRRKKINNLYSSPFLLPPDADRMVSTISIHLSPYMCELQKEVENLVQKKEELLSRLSRQRELKITRTIMSGREEKRREMKQVHQLQS
ncbi:transcription factor ORG2-like, partial [Daucus carota subsp. sativus]|uniref:transcription factor ORG2-like n=1 Tax=Daucus carota subsp. sativus TaxID=79200 RepID=UPI003083E291